MSRSRTTVLMCGAVLGLATFVAASGTASAHAELLSISPPADSIVDVAPTEIMLTFSESVDAVPDSIRVVTGGGQAIDIGDIRGDGNTTISADLPPLDQGSYVVAWRAVSADSHPISGAFLFSVGVATTADPGLVDQVLADAQPADGSERWLGVGRTASYLGVTSSVGAVAILSLLAPSLVARRRTRTLLLASLSIGGVGTVVMIAAQASIALNDVWAWGEVARSSAGRWWFVRLAGIEVATSLVLLRTWGSAQRWWSACLAVLGIGLLAVVTAGGHGITGRYVALGFAATVLHLGAISAWLGGLVALTLAVPRSEVLALAGRFSPIALCSVIVLAATGVFNAWRQIGSWDALTDSDYGTWLVVKLTLLAAVVAVAVVSRWLLHQSGTTHPTPTNVALSRTIVAEVVGIVLVLVATAGLVNAAPPRTEATPAIASTTVVQGDRLAQITLDPTVTGGTAMHVYISSSSGSLDQPTEISVSASLASQGIGPLSIPVVAAGPGHVTAPAANLPIAGTWTFSVVARFSEFDQVTFTGDLEVR